MAHKGIDPLIVTHFVTVAFHEAGHAAMAISLGLDVVSVSANLPEEIGEDLVGGASQISIGFKRADLQAGRLAPAAVEPYGMVLLAGAVAEWHAPSRASYHAKHKKRPPASEVRGKFVRSRLTGDIVNLLAVANQLFPNDRTRGAWMGYLWRRTIDAMVTPEVWPVVESIAKAVMRTERFAIAGDQIARAVTDAEQPDLEFIEAMRDRLHAARPPFRWHKIGEDMPVAMREDPDDP